MDFTDVALTALQVVSPVLVAALTWAAAKLASFGHGHSWPAIHEHQSQAGAGSRGHREPSTGLCRVHVHGLIARIPHSRALAYDQVAAS